MSQSAQVSRDVQDELLTKERRRKRKPGTIPYPVQYSKDLLVYDNWNHVFLSSLVRNITMHQFETPPSRILDLGCGDGLWVIEAARKWPKSQLVGFDILANQPDFTRPELELADVAPRVTWVHGNLLDPLPFPSERFDFVRICEIGLGVPEDEWQFLLEEVARVLLPGGILELIEEDLIFPSGRTKLFAGLSNESNPPSARPSYGYGGSSSTLSYASTPSTHSSDRRNTTSRVSFKAPNSLDSGNHLMMPRDMDQLLDPQDHSKLKTAWEAMLHHRFLTPSLLSVLPFYLSSSFRDIQMMPTLHIVLPPNSYLEDNNYGSSHFFHDGDVPSDLSALYLDLKVHGSRWSSDSRADRSSTRSRQSSATISSWASLHLARSVQTIRGCKEAIWAEYKELAGVEGCLDANGVVMNQREEFEAAWTNWENDMKDRVNVRGKLQECLSWSKPFASERPGWKVWRERVGEEVLPETDSHFGPDNLCRSLRGFVGWKPKNATNGSN
ncbi:hypothetical protein AcW1_008122 [Taiwanofungus camphoratus]|nr:hypothetical protein AcV5_008423 [Antrodia cinnamomea]KAI0950956.1 hypothetical protein AcW1_008122 [Antrodia cinnamomea]